MITETKIRILKPVVSTIRQRIYYVIRLFKSVTGSNRVRLFKSVTGSNRVLETHTKYTAKLEKKTGTYNDLLSVKPFIFCFPSNLPRIDHVSAL